MKNPNQEPNYEVPANEKRKLVASFISSFTKYIDSYEGKKKIHWVGFRIKDKNRPEIEYDEDDEKICQALVDLSTALKLSDEEKSDILTQMLEKYDIGMAEHCTRLTKLALITFNKLGLSSVRENNQEISAEEYIRYLNLASRIHNVGKLGIPRRIILSDRSLTEKTRPIVEKHSECGEVFARRLDINKFSLDFIEHHHENWNGSGYPDHQEGLNISLGSRILRIIDIYDSLVSDRIYRKGLTHNEAMKIIQEGSGSLTDPELIDLFVKIPEEVLKDAPARDKS